MKQNKIKKLTSFFYEVGALRRVLRVHQQMLLVHDPTDNIASHSFRTAYIGYFIAKELKADADKVLKMCLLHDLEEVRANDHNWVHKRYVKVFDEEIRQEQLNNFSGSKELSELSIEYAKRETLESKISKDADLLDEIFLLREYEHAGNKEAADWLKEGARNNIKKNQQVKQMFTDLAKNIALEAGKQKPSDWWEDLWIANRRK